MINSSELVYQSHHLPLQVTSLQQAAAKSRDNWPEASCTHESVVSRAEAKLQSHFRLTAPPANQSGVLRGAQPMARPELQSGRDDKVLKNNSLINLQQGAELVVQTSHRSYLRKTFGLFRYRQILVFTLTNKQVSPRFFSRV